VGTDADELVTALQDAYDLVPPVTTFALEHAGLNNVNAGIQTGAGAFVVRVHDSLSYQDTAAIAYEHRVLAWLATRRLSFAVPVPLPTRDGAAGFHGPWGAGETDSRAAQRPHGRRPGGWTALTPKLPGSPLAVQPAYDPALLGAAVGELQVALESCPDGPRPGRPLFGEIFRFGSPSLDAARLRPEDVGLPSAPTHDALFGRWREEAARLESFVDGAYRELPAQVCHNDLTPNNVLALDGTVTAVLDFEYVTRTPRALDFVTGLRAVMQYWKEPAPWAEARAYCQGYARWVSLSEAEIAAIPDLLRLRAAITGLWWIGRAAATGTVGPLVNRLGRIQQQWAWQAHADAPLMEAIREALQG
jgi:homoserine kinase type II